MHFMKFNLKIGAVTVGLLLTIIPFISGYEMNSDSIRPTSLLIEIKNVSKFKPSLVTSGGTFASADVEQNKENGRLSGWMWPLQGYIEAYSSKPGINQYSVRQMGLSRPDVVTAMSENKEYEYSGYDFSFDIATYGQIECVVWINGDTQDLLWQREDSQCLLAES